MRRTSQNIHGAMRTLLAPVLLVFSVSLYSSIAYAVPVEFFSDGDGNYAVKNSSTSNVDCNAPAVCDVSPGRYRLIQFDDFHSVYVTVENNGSVRYTYDGGADFPFADAANTSTNSQQVSDSRFVRVNFLRDSDSDYSVKNSVTNNIDCIAPSICDVAPGRYRLINFNDFHSVYVTIESNGSVRYTYDGGGVFPFATTTTTATTATTATTTTTATTASNSTTTPGFVQVNFLSDNDGAYLVRNSATNDINCLAPAICDVSPGRYRLINFDNLHSVYVTVENNGSVRYTYDGGADFPFAVAASENSNVDEIASTVTNPIPKLGSTFYWQLQGEIFLDYDVDMYGIDLEDNEFNGVISSLHSRGKKVSCYISAGSYEAWRSDSSQFNLSADLGNRLGDWPGEYYLDINSANVRRIMQSRINRAVAAGCDALEPDNTDAYQARNGLGLTAQDQINYLLFLANYAHSKGLSIGLKNTVDLIANASLVNAFDWTLNESCYSFNECSKLKPFINSGKAVFIAMYGKQNVSARCADAATNRFDLAFYGSDYLLNGSTFYTCPD